MTSAFNYGLGAVRVQLVVICPYYPRLKMYAEVMSRVS